MKVCIRLHKACASAHDFYISQPDPVQQFACILNYAWGMSCSFGGALMVTNGASFKSYKSVITTSAVSTPDKAGAAIWLGQCQPEVRPSFKAMQPGMACSAFLRSSG